MTQDLQDAEIWVSARLAQLRVMWPEANEELLMQLAETEFKLVVTRRQVEELGETPKA